MKDNYEVRGCFYRLNGLNCRKYLDIRRRNSDLQKADLLVVMMNPGNSRPVDGKYVMHRKAEAIPDRTQEQIMRLMKNCEFEYSRILNLTDIQETKSKKLFRTLADIKKKNLAHSIFDPRRKEELNELIPKNASIVFAWGVAEELTELAQQAVKRFAGKSVCGLQKDVGKTAYYHPLPPSYYKQKEWVNLMTEKINNTRHT